MESCVGEISKLESKVVYAISRLQNGKKSRSGKRNRKVTGVTNQQVVDYLCKNYRYLDGDIESQVTTALLSCVKNGIVCILNDGRYQLVGPSSKMMLSNCMTRTSHSSKCRCLNIVNLMSKIYPNPCCSLKWKKQSGQGNINKILRKSQRKVAKNKKKNPSKQKVTQRRQEDWFSACQDYAKKAMNVLEVDSKTKFTKKCPNCIQDEPIITREKLRRNISMNFPRRYVVPPDKFTASEEFHN